jgi:hypothetical protein
MSLLLSIDPGKRHCGCTLWCDGRLVRAELAAPDLSPGDTLAEIARATAETVAEWLHDERSDNAFMDKIEVVCEYPQTYGGRAARGDANDLIELGVVVGVIIANLGAPATLCRPQEWKRLMGAKPKPQSKAEYEREGYLTEQRVRAALDAEESARVVWPKAWKTKMDVADALGIGLWRLKTTGARR